MNPTTIKILKDTILAVELSLDDHVLTTTMDRVIDFENRLTLNDIKHCLENTDEDLIPEAIKRLLAVRWERIKSTPLSYTEAPFNEINCLCVELAKIISPLPDTQDELDELQIGEGPYFQLMPTLAVAQDISLTNIHEYKLDQFILSDDNSVFIPLKLCLDYSKDRQEGLFHVASNDDANYTALSSNEIERISNHSRAVRDYLQAVLNLQTAKKESNELGPRLRRLIHALRKGGVKKQGDELNAGAAANEGIVDFMTYWEKLSSSMHSELYRKYEGLEPLFGRLMRPDSANYRETTYCVELIANALETICDTQRIGTIAISDFENECTRKQETLIDLYRNNRRYTLLPQKSNFNRFLPLIFQLPINEQQRILNLPEGSNAWVYALEHAPEVLVHFAPFLKNDDKARATLLRFSNGMTPLFVAADNGCESAMRLLIECGISINAFDGRKNTPLMKTAMNGKIQGLTFLLSQNALIDAQNESQDTALTLAIKAGHREIVDALLAKNASLAPWNIDGQKAIQIAAARHPELLESLLVKAMALPLAEQAKLFDTPRHNALTYTIQYHPGLFNVLLKKAIDENRTNILEAKHTIRSSTFRTYSSEGSTLSLACLHGEDNTICALIDRFIADMNAPDYESFTPLHRAVSRGKLAVVTHLLQKNASLDTRNSLGETALMLAVSAGNRPIIDALLAQNASMTIRSQSEKNILDLAIESHPELIGPLLLKASQLPADQQKELLKHIRGNYDSVVSYATAQHPTLTVPILREVIQQGNSQLLNATHTIKINEAPTNVSTLGLAVQYGTIDDVRALIEAGATVTPADPKNLTPLMIAAREGKADIVALLLENNASIDDENNGNYTALQCAIRNKHLNIVNTLLAKNASITIRKEGGLNALDLAIRYASDGLASRQQKVLQLDLIETLLKKALQLRPEEQKECLRYFDGDYENVMHYAVIKHPSHIMPLLRSALQQRNGQILNSYFVADVDLRRGYLEQPIHIQSRKISTLGLAILYGNMDDVRALLEAGVPIDSPDRSVHSALMLAVEKEYIGIIALLLEQNASITLRNTSGNNAFDMARKINTNMAEMLLRKAIRLDLAQQEELTTKQSEIPKNVLSYAAQDYKHLVSPMLKDIIQQKNTALINMTHRIYHMHTNIEVSTLGLAVLYGTVDDVRALLLAGATVDPVNSTTTSALILAIISNKKEIVTLLLELNASSNGMDPQKNTVLEIALTRPSLCIIETLLAKNALITSRCLDIAQAYDRRDFELLLLKASSLGLDEQKELLKYLKPGPHETVLSYTAEVNTRLFKSILNIAIETKNRAILDATFMVYLGPNKTPYKTSTLALVARVGDSALIQALLDAGVGINPTEPGHLSALMMAAMEGRSEIVKYLLNKNASIDLINTDNNTALNLAIINGNREMVEALLNHNASIASRNTDNRNALDLANAYQPALRKHILMKAVTLSLEAQKELFENTFNKYENVLSYAIDEVPEHLNALLSEAIKSNSAALLNASHTVYRPNKQTYSTLTLAILSRVEATVRDVLALGVDCNAVTTDSQTALQHANAWGCENIIVMLLDSGARINLCAYQNDDSTIQWTHKTSKQPDTLVKALRKKGFPCPQTIKGHEIAKASLQFLPSEKKIILTIMDNAIHLKSKEALSALTASIPSEITHVSINGDDPVEKTKLSDTPLMMLYKINFNEHLKRFKDIERSMRLNAESAQKIVIKNNKQKPTYKAAADAADTLCKALEGARDTFLRTRNKVEFIANCETAVQGAQELTRHRGCRLAIAEFMRALLSLISKKAVTYLTNKYHLFTPKTTSHKKLDEFTMGITVEKNRIPL
jgi:ankyrin repeat protein